MRWQLSSRFDARAVRLADKHYNRQKVGSPQFVPPGSCLVLLTTDERAVWVTSWPKPEYVRHRWAGAWVNSIFRLENGRYGEASELIRDAVAATLYHYGAPPALGLVSFIDPTLTKRKRDPGFCYLKAGFERDGATEGGLVAMRMRPETMPPPAMFLGCQGGLFT